MAKDPAFLFYSSDFLSGISDLTMEERGQYITLLCLQHQKGVLNEKTIRLSVGSVSVDVMSKFTKDESGFFFNERLLEETEKRNKFTESRRSNGLQGGRPKEINKPLGKPKNNHKDNLMEDENENKNEIKDKGENQKKIAVEIIMPFDQEFSEQWGQWKNYKKLEFKFNYKSPQSEQSSLNELASLSKGNKQTAIKIINQSMSNGWKGFFELKNFTDGTNKSNNGTFKNTLGSKSGGFGILAEALRQAGRG